MSELVENTVDTPDDTDLDAFSAMFHSNEPEPVKEAEDGESDADLEDHGSDEPTADADVLEEDDTPEADDLAAEELALGHPQLAHEGAVGRVHVPQPQVLPLAGHQGMPGGDDAGTVPNEGHVVSPAATQGDRGLHLYLAPASGAREDFEVEAFHGRGFRTIS